MKRKEKESGSNGKEVCFKTTQHRSKRTQTIKTGGFGPLYLPRRNQALIPEPNVVPYSSS